jgi:cytochrome P450 family 6
LTQNPEAMQKIKINIKETLKKHENKLTYDSIMDMKYVDFCVKETLRKYPGLPILNRQCTKDYKIPGSSFTIKKGTSVIIPVLGIHRDERYFPNPNKYDPERFSDNRKDYFDDLYMPFGNGPRNCIAYRMGLLLSKTAIVMLLMNFDFEALKIEELEFDYGAVALLPKPGQGIIKIKKLTSFHE